MAVCDIGIFGTIEAESGSQAAQIFLEIQRLVPPNPHAIQMVAFNNRKRSKHHVPSIFVFHMKHKRTRGLVVYGFRQLVYDLTSTQFQRRALGLPSRPVFGATFVDGTFRLYVAEWVDESGKKMVRVKFQMSYDFSHGLEIVKCLFLIYRLCEDALKKLDEDIRSLLSLDELLANLETYKWRDPKSTRVGASTDSSLVSDTSFGRDSELHGSAKGDNTTSAGNRNRSLDDGDKSSSSARLQQRSTSGAQDDSEELQPSSAEEPFRPSAYITSLISSKTNSKARGAVITSPFMARLTTNRSLVLAIRFQLEQRRRSI